MPVIKEREKSLADTEYSLHLKRVEGVDEEKKKYNYAQSFGVLFKGVIEAVASGRREIIVDGNINDHDERTFEILLRKINPVLVENARQFEARYMTGAGKKEASVNEAGLPIRTVGEKKFQRIYFRKESYGDLAESNISPRLAFVDTADEKGILSVVEPERGRMDRNTVEHEVLHFLVRLMRKAGVLTGRTDVEYITNEAVEIEEYAAFVAEGFFEQGNGEWFYSDVLQKGDEENANKSALKTGVVKRYESIKCLMSVGERLGIKDEAFIYPLLMAEKSENIIPSVVEHTFFGYEERMVNVLQDELHKVEDPDRDGERIEVISELLGMARQRRDKKRIEMSQEDFEYKEIEDN